MPAMFPPPKLQDADDGVLALMLRWALGALGLLVIRWQRIWPTVSKKKGQNPQCACERGQWYVGHERRQDGLPANKEEMTWKF